jgi:hypothetical protein
VYGGRARAGGAKGGGEGGVGVRREEKRRVRGGGRCGQQRCLGYLMRLVAAAVREQPWCRCMRDADCAWLLMVVVGSRFFLFPCMWWAALVWWAGRWHGLWMSVVLRRHGHDGRWGMAMAMIGGE